MKKYALIISNAKYDHLSDLAATTNDAHALATTLADASIGGFDVTEIHDQTASTTLAQIAAFLRQRRSGDLVLLYFSGHGLLDEDDLLYLAAAQTQQETLPAFAIAATQLVPLLNRCAAKRQVLVLDCCYSGAWARGTRKSAGAQVKAATRFEGQGRIVLSASDETQVAHVDNTTEIAQSLFSRFLVQGLRTGAADSNQNGKITVREWYEYAHDEVVKVRAAQTPVIGGEQRGRIVLAANPFATPINEIPQPTQPTQRRRLKVKEWIVRDMGGGDFTTIGAAIQAASVGDKIIVLPGYYDEALVIDKSLEIVGEGVREEIVLTTSGANVIKFKARRGVIRNLTVRQTDGKYFAIDVMEGRLTLDGCDVSCREQCGVGIHGAETYVLLQENVIQHCGQAGIYFFDHAQGLVRQCNLFENGSCGIFVWASDPIVHNNQIHQNKLVGVVITEDGRGTIKENVIYNNGTVGVEVRQLADPVIRNNKVYDNETHGILVYQEGHGTIEENVVHRNGFSGICVSDHASPIVHHNGIHENMYNGIVVAEGANPVIHNNQIHDNKHSGIVVAEGANPLIHNNQIHENRLDGILTYNDGQGTFEENTLFGNGYHGVEVRYSSNPTIRNNQIHDNEYSGIYIHKQGRGTFEVNIIFGNGHDGVAIEEDADPVIRNNQIHDNKRHGVHVCNEGGGTFENNTLRNNERGNWRITDDSKPNVTRVNNSEE